MKWDVAVVGAGAAGLMCAGEASRRGRRVILLEKNDRVGKKILISGGGRCNFTNLHCTHQNFVGDNPDFCRSALSCFTPADFVRRVDTAGISHHEKKAGQLFCDRSARDIVDMLVSACGDVSIQLGCDIRSVRKKTVFEITCAHATVLAESLVIATGGPSIPKMGATAWGYDIARQFGLRLVEPRPALVPLVWANHEAKVFGRLAGVSVESEVSCAGRSFRDALLFTHRGLSGPAILQISSYWNPGDDIHIDFLPEGNALSWLASRRAANRTLEQVLRENLPERLAGILSEHFAPRKTLNHFTNLEMEKAAQVLSDFTFQPAGTEGFDKAEVTRGGVDTRELSSKTMECCEIPGLYFIGEVVDVTGHLGGHNFQWAWSSGFVAGQNV